MRLQNTFKVASVISLSFMLVACGNSLPHCDSSDTTDLLEEIVNEMPIVMSVGAQFVEVKNIKEHGYNEKAELRSCSATLITTAGEDHLQYHIRWHDKESSEFWVEAQIQ